MESNDSDLEELPTEILGKVMESLDSTHDLHAMIRSSPRFLRIFLHSPEKMLFSVLQQFLGPEAMYHGIAVIKVPYFPFRTFQSDINMEQGLLDRYLAHDDQLSDNFAMNRRDLVGLVRITSQVRFCIDHYANTTLSELDAAIEKLDPLRYLASTGSIIRSFLGNGLDAGINHRSDIKETPKVYNLSAAELERLQRAFFRFELFHRLHHSTRESFTLKLQPWEVLEIISIRDYVDSRLDCLMNEIMNEMRGKIWAALGRPNMDGHLWEYPTTKGRFKPYDWTELEAARERGDIVSSSFLRRDLMVDWLRRPRLLDTKCLTEFLRGDTTRLLGLIRSCYEYYSGGRPQISWGMQSWQSNGSWRMDTQTGPHVANLGYKLWDLPDVHQGNLQMLTQVYFQHATLGHVFWDASRIGYGGAFLAIDDVISKRAYRRENQSRPLTRVEWSLERVSLPANLLEDIFMEYGLVPMKWYRRCP